MTDYSLTRLLNKLTKLFNTDKEKIDALNYSIEGGYPFIYEPNSKNSNERRTSKDVTDW
jgi:predicted transcriptional regulator